MISRITAAVRSIWELPKIKMEERRNRPHFCIIGADNVIHADGSQQQDCRFEIYGSHNHITVASGCRLNNVTFHILGDHHQIQIDENCTFRNTTLWIEDTSCAIRIGRDTTMEGGGIAATEPGSTITIGQDCMFSFDIDIRCGDSHSIIDLETGKRINYAQDVHIGDHVWLGAGVRVLKGATIGTHAIVGSGAIVTGDISAHTAAAGIPAKRVRENVTWARERIIKPNSL